MKRTPRNRILSLDVRSRRVGYAAFEPPHLIDFGVARFKSEKVATLRLASLLLRIRPATLVLRKISASSSRHCPGTIANQHLARTLARRSSITVAFVSERHLQAHFDGKEMRTRYAVAEFLSRTYPELEWRLPHPRKPWETEYRNMSIFDAAALGVAYLESDAVVDETEPQITAGTSLSALR